jgi:hypothetical protein
VCEKKVSFKSKSIKEKLDVLGERRRLSLFIDPKEYRMIVNTMKKVFFAYSFHRSPYGAALSVYRRK